MRASPLLRFFDKVKITDTCWLWTGAKDGGGYGRFSCDGKPHQAHRWLWEQVNGPVPEGLKLDHVLAWGCAHHNCVKLAHLEPVTQKENLRRGKGVGQAGAALQRAKTHCPQGHSYAVEGGNLYVYPDGSRNCRTCAREANRRWRETRRMNAN